MKLSITLKMNKTEIATILETKATFEQNLFNAMGKTDVEVPAMLEETINIKIKSNWSNVKAYLGLTNEFEVQVDITTNERLMGHICELFTEFTKLTIPVSVATYNMFANANNNNIKSIIDNIKYNTNGSDVEYKKTKGDKVIGQ